MNMIGGGTGTIRAFKKNVRNLSVATTDHGNQSWAKDNRACHEYAKPVQTTLNPKP